MRLSVQTIDCRGVRVESYSVCWIGFHVFAPRYNLKVLNDNWFEVAGNRHDAAGQLYFSLVGMFC